MRSGAAQQLQQEGLGLIIAVMGRQQRGFDAEFGGESRVASIAGSGFRAVAGRRPGIDFHHPKRNRQLIANASTMIAPTGRSCLQVVIDMDCRQCSLRSKRAIGGQQMQQHMGIQATAVADDQMTGLWMIRQECGHCRSRWRKSAHKSKKWRGRSAGAGGSLSLPSRAATLLCQDDWAEVAGSASLNIP